MGRHWSKSEICAACKGYTKATLNTHNVADQHVDQFEKEIVERMNEYFPADVADGTYYFRAKIYKYIHDNVFNMFQKFSKLLRHVHACNPTGVTEEEKVNMVVALFNGEKQKMDDAFKSYNSKR